MLVCIGIGRRVCVGMVMVMRRMIGVGIASVVGIMTGIVIGVFYGYCYCY